MRKITLKTVKRKTKFSRLAIRKAVAEAYADVLTPEVRKIKDPLKKAKAMLSNTKKLKKEGKRSLKHYAITRGC